MEDDNAQVLRAISHLPKFDRTNVREWKFEMDLALNQYDLKEIVAGTSLRPAEVTRTCILLCFFVIAIRWGHIMIATSMLPVETILIIPHACFIMNVVRWLTCKSHKRCPLRHMLVSFMNTARWGKSMISHACYFNTARWGNSHYIAWCLLMHMLFFCPSRH